MDNQYVETDKSWNAPSSENYPPQFAPPIMYIQQLPVIQPLSYLSVNLSGPLVDSKKRPASSTALDSVHITKRHTSAGSHKTREERALRETILDNRADNAVESFDTFQSQDDSIDPLDNLDAKVPKEELDRLIQSIPLEDRAKINGDIDETVVVCNLS